jgi:hypothetical protein
MITLETENPKQIETTLPGVELIVKPALDEMIAPPRSTGMTRY